MNYRVLTVTATLVFVLGCGASQRLLAGDYASQPAGVAVVDAAVAEGVDREWAESVIAAASRQQSILDAMSRPAEKTKPWHEYRDIFMTQKRIDAGVEFAAQHADVLSTVAADTGVPVEIITAIIGVETYYGRIAGSYRVVDALATLAFDYPKRSEFFTSELENFLVLAWESGKDPLQLKGSYAGAMGFGQFMPSSYRAYAVDYDGDEVIDIWENPSDAIASVANYFIEHGWRAGRKVVVPASGDKASPEVFGGGLKPRFTVSELIEMGFEPLGEVFVDDAATAMKLEGKNGPEYWMGLHNFYVITRYNHSSMYALSVWQLSEAIAEAMRSQ
ncbi:lytic murein transglycosylase B [Luminiphilus syltensis NOR5-1B]|uniref:Lytic murein transglycosylase B n=1 Tax=Luminiphilus syltensis NOR5-1B TaxID=565045 RepID=B8KSL9_9GAMM|nr:lytic murein transglycosylase B [Luminiphilus syltensis]EED36336.1 lytic murein transglycosylase B [Luminiphilus syltensis NOR5-1B]